MTKSGIYRFLLRYSESGYRLYYAGGYQQGTHTAGSDDLIGVCLTPKMQRPDTTESREEFEESVEEVATDVRWFDSPIKGGVPDDV